MKKIMILGCGVYQIPLIEYAIKHYSVILVAPDIPDEIKKKVAHFYLIDLREQEEILKYAQKEKIDGIITDQTDIPVRTVAYVAEKMGLHGITYETSCLFSDKHLMREKLKELGLQYIPYKTSSNASDAVVFAESIGFPVIIKPVDNQGSRGVFKIENPAQLYQQFDAAISVSLSKQVIVEKYITGREAVVEGLVMNYQYQTLICGDTYYFEIKDSFAAKTRIFPSKLSNDIQGKITSFNQQIIKGFGLKQGITHSEFLIDENDDVYLIETAARGGGVFISSDLISLRTGLNTEKFLTDIAVNGTSNIKLSDTGKVCCYIAFFLPKGEIVSISGVEEVKRFPFVHRNLLDTIRIGMKTKKAEDKTSRFSIIVSADNFDELDQNIQQIKNVLKVKTVTEHGIENPIWE